MLSPLRRYWPVIPIAAVFAAGVFFEWTSANGARQQTYAAAAQAGASPGIAAELRSDHFMSDLTKPDAISSFTIDPDHYSHLSPEQRQDALSAKAIFGSFLRALQAHEKNVSRFLAPDFPSRNLSTEETLGSFIAEETSIKQHGISDIQLRNDGNVIDLEFYVVVISEGTFNIGKGTVTMTKTRDGWKVSAIKTAK